MAWVRWRITLEYDNYDAAQYVAKALRDMPPWLRYEWVALNERGEPFEADYPDDWKHSEDDA
jgi:hypothetical protein